MGYDGFISYSHAADGRLAPALQRGLQRLAKRWNSRRALHVFRDETGLSTNPHLWSAIETALDNSDWFVLLASPESAASEWVNKEVAHWVATKPADHILPVVTDGTWEWDASTGDFTADSTSVPLALRGALREEARHLDLRWARGETDLDLRNSRFRAAIADLTAPMHGIAKDELEGEDIRQHRRAQRLARGGTTVVVLLMIVSVVFGALAVGQRNQARSAQRQANAQRDRADRATNTALAGGLAARANGFLHANQGDLALLLAAESDRFGNRLPAGAAAAGDARSALLGALSAQPASSGYLEGQQGALASVKYSPDGKTIASTSFGGDLRVWDAATRQPLAHQPPRTTAASNVAVNDAGLLVTSGRIWDLRTNRPWRWQVPASDPWSFAAAPGGVTTVAISDQGMLAIGSSKLSDYLSPGPTTSETLDLWNVNTGRRVGSRITLAGTIDSVAFSHDGTQLGVDLIDNDAKTIDLALIDAATGRLERRLVAHAGGATFATGGTNFDFTDFNQIIAAFFDAVVFSSDGRRVSSVVGAAADGLIAAFDTATGKRLATPATKPREIMAVSADLREVLDQTAHADFVADAVTDAPLGASYPADNTAGTGSLVNVAFDPTRPNLVYQSGKGALTILDWTHVGPLHFALPVSTRRVSTDVTISPAGRVIDLAEALHQLGVGSSSPSHGLWIATASATGSVAILTSKGALAIWNPDQRRIERRLTAAPPGCAQTGSLLANFNLAYVGRAQHGRVVLECAGSLQSWDLTNATSAPAWHEKWDLATNRGLNVAYVSLSNDGNTMVDLSTGASRVVDARTGKLRATGPTDSGGSQRVRIFISPDARTLATVGYSGSVDLIDTTTGVLRATLTSNSTVTAVDVGPVGNGDGAFSPDGHYFASWQDTRGLEIWDLHTGQSIGILDGRATAPFSTLVGAGPTQPADPSALARDLVVSFGPRDDTVTVTDAQQLAAPQSSSDVVRAVTWSLQPADWVTAACTIVGRDLTTSEWNLYVGPDVPYHPTCTPLLDTHR